MFSRRIISFKKVNSLGTHLYHKICFNEQNFLEVQLLSKKNLKLYTPRPLVIISFQGLRKSFF